MVVTLSDIGDRIEEDKAFQRLSAKKIVDLLVPDKETLNAYLKDLAKYDLDNHIATVSDGHSEWLNQALKDKRLYGLDVEDILKQMGEN